MPVSNASVAVGTTAVAISNPSINFRLVYVQDGDFDGDSVTFIGGDSVATSSGVKLSKTNVTVFQMNADDTLYAISTTAGGSVRVTEIE